MSTSQISVYVNSKRVTKNFLPTCKSITWRLIALLRIVYISDFQQILFIHVLKMFFISNDSNGFIRHAWTNTILITEQREPEEWKGFKNNFYRFSQLLATFLPENKTDLNTNDNTWNWTWHSHHLAEEKLISRSSECFICLLLGPDWKECFSMRQTKQIRSDENNWHRDEKKMHQK